MFYHAYFNESPIWLVDLWVKECIDPRKWWLFFFHPPFLGCLFEEGQLFLQAFCGMSRYRSDFLETFRLEDLKELLATTTSEGIRIKAADLIREMEEAESKEPKAGGMTMNFLKQGLIQHL